MPGIFCRAISEIVDLDNLESLEKMETGDIVRENLNSLVFSMKLAMRFDKNDMISSEINNKKSIPRFHVKLSHRFLHS